MIELDKVTLIAGDFRLQSLSLQIPTGKYAVLMGRTGRGKTTILESICGLRKISSGRLLINEMDVTRWEPADRQIGYVPQDLALFPNLNVRQHIEFALRLRRWEAKKIHQRTDELSTELEIRHLLSRKIHGLSGGESQRVALGRALSFDPSVLLLDEPLSALDDSTRDTMYRLLKRVTSKRNVTTLHVTHNEEEAATMADLRIELSDGQLHCQ